MTDLIAMLSTGKGSWARVSALIKAESWENIYLVTNSFGKEKFVQERPMSMIVLNDNDSTEQMRDKIADALQGRLKMDVAVNFVSGSGDEHMALIAALVKLGVGLRFITGDDGIKEL